MIAHVLNLARWEWFKLRRRRMPWILLVILVAVPLVSFWATFGFYQSRVWLDSASMGQTYELADGSSTTIEVSCRDVIEGDLPAEIDKLSQADRQRALDNIESFRSEACESAGEASQGVRNVLELPLGISFGLVFAHTVGVMLIIVLASSVIGTEYGWGTLRAALIQGIGRWQFLTSKALLVMLVGAGGILVAAVAVAVSGLVAAPFLEFPNGESAQPGHQWSDAAIAFGKTIYGLVPYVALAMLFAVLTSSSGVGMAIALGYHIVEQVVVGILMNFGWFEGISHFVLGRAVGGWLNVTVNGGPPDPIEPTDALQGALVMLAYTVILGAIALWVFQRRDIAGAKGE